MYLKLTSNPVSKLPVWVLLLILSSCHSGDEQSVALGTVERERVALTATADEIVMKLPVEVGNPVKRGQLLVQLDDREQQALLEKAGADIAEKQATLTKLQNGARPEDVAAAQATLREAEANLVYEKKTLKRYKELLSERTISQAKFDQVSTSLKTAMATRDNAREALLRLTNGTRPEDLQFAVAQLDAAKAVYAVQKQRLSELSVVATRDGVLETLPWNLGERVSKGTPVAIVLSGGVPHVRVYIPEQHRAKIKAGTTLVVSVDGIDEPYQGSVRWVANSPAFTPYYALNAEERARLVYLAEVSLPESARELPGGIPAQVHMP